jgi:hypothetical protein
MSESRILVRFLRMYFPRNWEFGSALSKFRNFGEGGFEHPKLSPTPPSVGHCLIPPVWRWPFEVETFCQIPDMKYTNSVDGISFIHLWSYSISKHPLLHVAHKMNLKSTIGCTNKLSTFSVTDTVIKSVQLATQLRGPWQHHKHNKHDKCLWKLVPPL